VQTVPRQTEFDVIGLELEGAVAVPERASGVVLFAHAGGADRHNATDVQIATELNQKRIATVLVNLLTRREQEIYAGNELAITALGARLIALIDNLALREATAGLPGGLCGTGSGAAGAFIAAAARPAQVHAVLSRAGRPELAGEFIRLVHCPTLLVVGETDGAVREVNERAQAEFPGTARVARVPGASVLREEPWAVELVTELAREWFPLRLGHGAAAAASR
jgi:putative phosphoribosyl transferase